MVEIEIIGNIGREDEIVVVTRESGATALRFPLAGTTGRGDKAKTAWFTCFYSCDPKFKEYLHKGMRVFVRGEYADGIFTNREGKAYIDRTISVRRLEFCESRQQTQPAPQAPV